MEIHDMKFLFTQSKNTEIRIIIMKNNTWKLNHREEMHTRITEDKMLIIIYL